MQKMQIMGRPLHYVRPKIAGYVVQKYRALGASAPRRRRRGQPVTIPHALHVAADAARGDLTEWSFCDFTSNRATAHFVASCCDKRHQPMVP